MAGGGITARSLRVDSASTAGRQGKVARDRLPPTHRLQLLCGACNRANGTGTQAELIAKLKERGQLAG